MTFDKKENFDIILKTEGDKMMLEKELKEYLKKNFKKEKKKVNFSFKKILFEEDAEIQTSSLNNIDEFIKENNNNQNFKTTLFKMIDERNLTDAEVYNKVHLDRRLFSKIRNDKNYHPSKETVILLGLALKLKERELETLLDSASYSLPKNNYYDLIIRFCFNKGIYKITDVNDLLQKYHCKLFNY